VTPKWFAHKNAQGAIDIKGNAQSQFQVLAGGYAQKYDPQKGWQQVNGDKALSSAMVANAPAGARRDRRKRERETGSAAPCDLSDGRCDRLSCVFGGSLRKGPEVSLLNVTRLIRPHRFGGPMAVRCYTRALKNARYLEKNAPRRFRAIRL